MLILGHAGLTLGAAVLLKSTLAKRHSLPPRANTGMERLESTSGMHSTQNYSSNGRAKWLAFLEKIDIRLLLIGSLLPDIIDKPVGQFFFRDTFSNGRIFSHTILFLLIITLAGFYLNRSYRKPWLLILCFGTFTHLIFDQMWLTPQTLLWPIYGFTFARVDLTHWTQNISYSLFTNPGVYVPELLGMAILIWFVLVTARRRKFYTLIKSGQAWR